MVDKKPLVMRQGATGRLLKMVVGLLERGTTQKEVSDWTRVELAFIKNVAKDMKKKPAKGKSNDESG